MMKGKITRTIIGGIVAISIFLSMEISSFAITPEDIEFYKSDSMKYSLSSYGEVIDYTVDEMKKALIEQGINTCLYTHVSSDGKYFDTKLLEKKADDILLGNCSENYAINGEYSSSSRVIGFISMEQYDEITNTLSEDPSLGIGKVFCRNQSDAEKWKEGAKRSNMIAYYKFVPIDDEFFMLDVSINQYVIKKGDTLTKIAEIFKTKIERLVEVNGIKDSNLIYEDQLIII